MAITIKFFLFWSYFSHSYSQVSYHLPLTFGFIVHWLYILTVIRIYNIFAFVIMTFNILCDGLCLWLNIRSLLNTCGKFFSCFYYLIGIKSHIYIYMASKNNFPILSYYHSRHFHLFELSRLQYTLQPLSKTTEKVQIVCLRVSQIFSNNLALIETWQVEWRVLNILQMTNWMLFLPVPRDCPS